MKRIGLTLLLLSLLLTNSYCAPLRWGLRFDCNIATIVGHHMESADNRLGVGLSFLREFPVCKTISFVPEIKYANIGFTKAYEYNVVSVDMDYICIPLMMRYKLLPWFGVEIGTQVSYLFHARIGNEYFAEKITDSFRTYDSGVAVGMNFDLPRGFITARYYGGISAIKDDPIRAHHSVASIGLGVKF